MMKKEFSFRRAAAVALISLGMASGALAHSEGGKGEGSPAKIRMQEKGAFTKKWKELREVLKLDAQQEALWTESVNFHKESWKKNRERIRAHHEEMKKLIAQPGMDAQALLKRMDAFEAEARESRLAQRERLLKVYNALNAEQKEQVRLFLKERFDHSKRKGYGHGRGHGW